MPGAVDLALALVHGYLGLVLAPSRRPAFVVVVGVMVALEAAAGVALLVGLRGSVRIGRAAAMAMIAFGAVVILLLCASAGYLRGAYGALGQGLALASVIAGIVVSHLFVVPGIWQLRRLR